MNQPEPARSAEDLPPQQRPGYELLSAALKHANAAAVPLEPSSLLNMETSNLAFQERILHLANDATVPLLERLKFISIFGGNMDEFFMTRLAGFKRQLGAGHTKRTLDGLRPEDQVRAMLKRSKMLFDRTYDEVLPELLRQLGEEGVKVLTWDELTDSHRSYLLAQYGGYLDTIVLPLLVHPGAPFPHVRNLRPAFAVRLRSDSHPLGLAILTLPSDAPSLVPLPGGRRFVPLEEILRVNLPHLLEGADLTDAYLFRVTRSGNLHLEFDTVGDVVDAVEENVAQRPFEPPVRVEVEKAMPADLRRTLLDAFASEAAAHTSVLSAQDLYEVDGLLDLKRLEAAAALPIPHLRYPPNRRRTPLPRNIPIFERLQSRDVLVRFPEHAFEATVERFISEAASDPQVEEIGITLYRTSRSSRIVRLLRRAHRRGKRVRAYIEVKATFDERRNIEWARSLEAAGIQVLYGPPELKVHAKIALVLRREGEVLRTYSYVGTGNLNAATAGAYTDLGVLTAESAVGAELADVFAILADEDAHGVYERLVVSPFNMRERFMQLIDREIENSRAGRPAAITAKLNGLADREVIAGLYAASAAGVRMDLLVRGICSLRPGVKGLSETIRVISLVGRFLEHARILRFENGGDPEYFIGSADWRGRNLSRRVEVVMPVRSERHCSILDRILEENLQEPTAWDLQPDGTYLRRGPVAVAAGEPLP